MTCPDPVVLPLRSALIVDDHPLFCDALALTLTGLVGIETIEAVGTLGRRWPGWRAAGRVRT